jgi:hypothetical protein
MIVFRRTCRSEFCQRGTRCSRCTHSVALPSSLHFAHASSMHTVTNIGSPVLWSRILISLAPEAGGLVSTQQRLEAYN